MALQQSEVDSIVQLILLIAAIILVALFLYIAIRLLTGKKETETGYLIRLLVVAAVIVILVAIVLGAIVGILSDLPLVGGILGNAAGRLMLILFYVAIIYLIRYILIPEKGELEKWTAAVWSGVIALFLVYLIDAILREVGLSPIIGI